MRPARGQIEHLNKQIWHYRKKLHKGTKKDDDAFFSPRSSSVWQTVKNATFLHSTHKHYPKTRSSSHTDLGKSPKKVNNLATLVSCIVFYLAAFKLLTSESPKRIVTTVYNLYCSYYPFRWLRRYIPNSGHTLSQTSLWYYSISKNWGMFKFNFMY